MGCAQAVLCLLRRHHHLVQGKGVFVELEDQFRKVLSGIDFLSCRDIPQTRGFDDIFSLLDISENESSILSGHCPEIVLADSDHCPGYRLLSSRLQHTASHLDTAVIGSCQSRSMCRKYRQHHQNICQNHSHPGCKGTKILPHAVSLFVGIWRDKPALS